MLGESYWMALGHVQRSGQGAVVGDHCSVCVHVVSSVEECASGTIHMDTIRYFCSG
jgi:hypothetical protein